MWDDFESYDAGSGTGMMDWGYSTENYPAWTSPTYDWLSEAGPLQYDYNPFNQMDFQNDTATAPDIRERTPTMEDWIGASRTGRNTSEANLWLEGLRNTNINGVPRWQNEPALRDASHAMFSQAMIDENPFNPKGLAPALASYPYSLAKWLAQNAAPSLGKQYDQWLGNRLGIPLFNASPPSWNEARAGASPLWRRY